MPMKHVISILDLNLRFWHESPCAPAKRSLDPAVCQLCSSQFCSHATWHYVLDIVGHLADRPLHTNLTNTPKNEDMFCVKHHYSRYVFFHLIVVHNIVNLHRLCGLSTSVYSYLSVICLIDVFLSYLIK